MSTGTPVDVIVVFKLEPPSPAASAGARNGATPL